MMYWWQNLITRFQIKGETIIKMGSQGCMGMNVFEWAGKVIGFEKGEKCDYIVIEIMIHNNSYGDNRSRTEPEIYKYPLVNADIQNVNGVWTLFT